MKTYEVFKPNARLLEGYPVVTASSSSEACKMVLAGMGIEFTHLTRSARRDVLIGAQPVVERSGGRREPVGNKVWYDVYRGSSRLIAG
jgi:hypothetical protein